MASSTSSALVRTAHASLAIPAHVGDARDVDAPLRPTAASVAETATATATALAAAEEEKAEEQLALRPKPAVRAKAKYVKYTPKGMAGASAAPRTRIIRVQEAAVDPLELPKFRRRSVPRVSEVEAVPILREPAKAATKEERAVWGSFPPCISNWKNNQGYAIPLDKRLAAERPAAAPTINDKFASLSEALYVAERTARREIAERASIRAKLASKEKEAKEAELRDLAARARLERAGVGAVAGGPRSTDAVVDKSVRERDELRRERKRERIRDLRQESRGKRSRTSREHERDISERVALGTIPASAKSAAAPMEDARLFNQTQGVGRGFGDAGDYNIYSGPLFARGNGASRLYRPPASSSGAGGGASGPPARERVEFERDAAIDKLLADSDPANKSK